MPRIDRPFPAVHRSTPAPFRRPPLSKASRPRCSAAGLVLLLACSLGALPALPPAGAQEPVDELVAGEWDAATGLVFAPGGRLFVWEKAGRVWLVEDGERQDEPVLDISDEVGNYNDYGLLSVAVDPAFEENGRIYLLYVVDHHHLANFGTPRYDPERNEYRRATIGRLTRYEVHGEEGEVHAHGPSRTVLIGKTASTGFPLLAATHGPGDLVFGSDGTLLVSCGDAASPEGGAIGSFADQGLEEGILRPEEDVAAFRAQLVDSLCGKVIRIDPDTGDGVESNPWFDPAAPRAPRSRVWALGFRQPYRMTLRPGTGSSDPSAGDPGTLYVGDVGWKSSEELDVVDGPALNFGWPLFEGLEWNEDYRGRGTDNLDAPNPLSGDPECTQEHFAFEDLIVQDTLDPDPAFPNPCEPTREVPESIPRFVHARPALAWRHDVPETRVPVFAGSEAEGVRLGSVDSPAEGEEFAGACSTAGVWSTGAGFPDGWQGLYFHGDYTGEWIRGVALDAEDRVVEVRDAFPAGRVVAIASSPAAGGLWYIRYPGELRRITWPSCGNRSPRAVATADRRWGPDPLEVRFEGSGSTDPDGDILEYRWDFGDGSPVSTEPDPTHVFRSPDGGPAAFDVRFSVRDPQGESDEVTFVVSPGNSPPRATITSPAQGFAYPLTEPTTLPLRAEVEDDEHARELLDCAWQVIFHHDAHVHEEPVDPTCGSEAFIEPLGCRGETYYYRTVFTVTDPLGLSTTVGREVHPDCESGGLPAFAALHVSVKPSSREVPAGAPAPFRAVLRNEGGVPLEDVRMLSPYCPEVPASGDDGDGVLATDETWEWQCAVPEVEVELRAVVAVEARDPDGEELTAEDRLEIEVTRRSTEGQVALYAFEEDGGDRIRDTAETGAPVDLTVLGGSATRLEEGGLRLRDAVVASEEPATRLTQSLRSTGEFSLEAWLRPADLEQDGPARIAALSVDGFPNGGNLVLGQSGGALELRVRTSASDRYGLPALRTSGSLLDGDLVHVIATRSACSGLVLWADGDQVARREPGDATLATWTDAARLALGNEPAGERPWSGDLRLVALYDRALTSDEVRGNFRAGPGAAGPAPRVVADPEPARACSGDGASFQVEAEGPGPLQYTWRHDGVAVAAGDGPVLALEDLAPEDAGLYDAVVRDPDGGVAASAPARLEIERAPRVVEDPADTALCAGEPLHLAASAEGSGPFVWRWRHDGEPVPGADGSELAIGAVTPAHTGLWVAEVEGPCGTVRSAPARVELLPEPGCDGAPVFLRGECNGDGVRDLSDSVALLVHLFLGEASPSCADACDTNDDGRLDVSDAIRGLGWLFNGEGALPPPSTGCGPDPVDDGLGCAEAPPCP